MDLPIKAAIDEVGGASQAADRLGISRISVYEWISAGRLPANRVLPVSELTGWKYTPHMLDPVLYPNPQDGLPLVNTEQVPQ